MRVFLFWIVFVIIVVPMAIIAIIYTLAETMELKSLTKQFDRVVHALEWFHEWCER